MNQPSTIQRASVTGNLLAGYTFQIAHYLIPLITLPFLVRVLGPDAFGKLVFVQVTMMFFILFMDAGIDTVAAKELSQIKDDRNRASLIHTTVTLLKLGMATCVIATAYLVLNLGIADDSIKLFLVTTPLLFGSVFFPTWLFQGLEVYRYAMICGVTGRLLTAVPLFLLVDSADDLLLAAFLQSSATLASGFLAWPIIRFKLSLQTMQPIVLLIQELKYIVKSARSLALAEFVDRATLNTPTFILGLFVGGPILGLFAASEKLIRAMHSLLYPFLRAVFPRFCRGWINNHDQTSKLARAGLLVTIACCSGAAVVTAAYAAEILELLYGGNWQANAWILQSLCVWFVFAGTNAYLGLIYLIATDRRKSFSVIILSTALSQILLSLAAIQMFGTSGLLFTMVLVESGRSLALAHAVFFPILACSESKETQTCAS